jgi:hypothetical protein
LITILQAAAVVVVVFNTEQANLLLQLLMLSQ